MKRLLFFLLALIGIFSACAPTHTAQWEPDPTPPVVSTIPRTPEEQLLWDLSYGLAGKAEAADHTLCGTAEYNGRKFALIASEGVANYLQLAEYGETDDGYTLLAVSDGWAFSSPGYIPIVAQFDDLTVCWSYITRQRLVPDNDGNSANDVYIHNDYTAIRIFLADGTVRDEPISCHSCVKRNRKSSIIRKIFIIKNRWCGYWFTVDIFQRFTTKEHHWTEHGNAFRDCYICQ